MRTKRILLAAVLLSLCAAASCAGESPAVQPGSSLPDSGEGTAASEIAGDSSSEPESEAVSLPVADGMPEPEIPEWDAGGRSFVIMSEPIETDWDIDFIDTESLNGEPVNDAVFKRNLLIEERFNVKVERMDSGYVAYDATKLVTAGDPTVDIAFGYATGLGDFIPSGYFMDLYDVPYIDFSDPFWYQLSVQGMTSYHRMFMMSSDFYPSPLQLTSVIYFNKKLIAENDLDNPYQLVYDNEWVLERFLSMIRQIGKDLNGDGIMNEQDLYGIGTYYGRRYGTFMELLIGCGVPITVIGPEGGRIVNDEGEKVQDLIDRTRVIFKDHSVAIDASEIEKLYSSWALLPLFVTDQLLFVSERIEAMQRAELREMQSDFGIVPNPKYDADQDQYYHRALAKMFSVPNTVADPSLCGAVMAYGTWLAHSTVLPAYYEITIKQKRTRDEDAIVMLDLIHETIYVDFSDLYDTHISDYMWNAYESGSYARSFASVLKKLTKTMDRIQNRILAIN